MLKCSSWNSIASVGPLALCPVAGCGGKTTASNARPARADGTVENTKDTDDSSRGKESRCKGADSRCKGADNRSKGADNRSKGTDNRSKGADSRCKGSDNRSKGTDNRSKGTDNRSKGTDSRTQVTGTNEAKTSTETHARRLGCGYSRVRVGVTCAHMAWHRCDVRACGRMPCVSVRRPVDGVNTATAGLSLALCVRQVACRTLWPRRRMIGRDVTR
jgi:hypothetical protein